MDVDSERSHETQTNGSALPSPTSADGGFAHFSSMMRFEDPFSFERDYSRERQPGTRKESLLSWRLKDLAFQAQRDAPGEQ